MPAAVLASLIDAFPRQRVGRHTYDVYERELGDIPPETLEAAARHLIRTSEFFPTVAEIRRAAAELELGLPTEEEALAEIEARAAWAFRREGDRGEPPPLHPLVARVLTHVGGARAFRVADDPSVVRGQFGRLYRDARAAALRRYQADGPDALPAASAVRALSA